MMKRLFCILLFSFALCTPVRAETRFLWIGVSGTVDPKAVVVSGFGYRNVAIFSEPGLVTIRYAVDRACYDLQVSGPRVVGRSTDLTACNKTFLPEVSGP